MRLASGSSFVPNDIRLGGQAPGFIVLTGPNMGGKSTLLRQVSVTMVDKVVDLINVLLVLYVCELIRLSKNLAEQSVLLQQVCSTAMGMKLRGWTSAWAPTSTASGVWSAGQISMCTVPLHDFSTVSLQ